jgi:plastocyanin
MRSIFLLSLAAAVSLHAADQAPPIKIIQLKTMTAQMKYDESELLVQPGEKVKIIFENGDDLPHNLVFCQPGTDTMTMAMKQMEKPEEALKRNWLPDDPSIWLHSKMLNPHESDELVFNAPQKPGDYPYVCTFPGHALTMNGKLKVLPLGEGLKDLKFALYLGAWQELPDFSKLTPHREGDVADQLIAIKLDDYKNEFGVVFTGKINAQRKGNYRFYIAGDDGVRLLVDGKMVVEYDGIHPSGKIKEGMVLLEKGEHVLRYEYFQGRGESAVYAAWKGPGFDITPLSSWMPETWKKGENTKEKIKLDPIPLVVAAEPVIYRNFIQGAGNRAIGVGYPGGINIAWNAESMNLALLWKGAFIDAAMHWNSRGGGHQPPLGYDVLTPSGDVSPAFFVTDKPESAWPAYDKVKRFEGFAWKGYALDAKRSPTFRYTWQGAEIEESFSATGDGNKPDGKPTLIRSVKISGSLPANAWYRLGVGAFESKDGRYVAKGIKPFSITAAGAQVAGQNLVIPAKAGTLNITYQWEQ